MYDDCLITWHCFIRHFYKNDNEKVGVTGKQKYNSHFQLASQEGLSVGYTLWRLSTKAKNFEHYE